MARETNRAVYIQRIDAEHKQDYVNAHDDVPEGVTEAMERGTVTAFDLYVRDDIAVCILEASDLDTYLKAVTDDPEVEKWERRVAQFKEEGVDVDAPVDEQIPFMEKVWSFRVDE